MEDDKKPQTLRHAISEQVLTNSDKETEKQSKSKPKKSKSFEEDSLPPEPTSPSKSSFISKLKNRKRTTSLKKVPSKENISVIFGISFDTLIGKEKGTIPKLIEKSIKLISEKGLKTEGLFRVSPNSDDLEFACKAIEEGGFDVMDHFDEHIVCGVLKKFLRLLPTPMLTYECYTCFIAIYAMHGTDDKIRVEKTISILDMIPNTRKRAVGELIHFLAKVAENSQYNKMTIQNLATIFAPLLLRQQEKSSADAISDVSTISNALQNLIENRFIYFPKGS